MVDAFGLREVVEVRGEPANIAGVIAGADVCIAPASEAPRFQVLGDLPQPLLEYLACHRPVVAAGVPGVAEILRDEQGLDLAAAKDAGSAHWHIVVAARKPCDQPLVLWVNAIQCNLEP